MIRLLINFFHYQVVGTRKPSNMHPKLKNMSLTTGVSPKEVECVKPLRDQLNGGDRRELVYCVISK